MSDLMWAQGITKSTADKMETRSTSINVMFLALGWHRKKHSVTIEMESLHKRKRHADVQIFLLHKNIHEVNSDSRCKTS